MESEATRPSQFEGECLKEDHSSSATKYCDKPTRFDSKHCAVATRLINVFLNNSQVSRFNSSLITIYYICQQNMITHYIIIAFGGALGSIIRVFLSKLLPTVVYGIPIPILSINILGCFIMGLLTEIMALYWSPPDQVRYFLIPGFLGGFTTFSTFALEFGLLFKEDKFLLALSYIVLSVVLSLLFFFIGVKIVRLL